MRILLFLFVWIFTALPLILVTSWAEFKKAYNLFDLLMDLLDKRSKKVRFILLAVFAALVVTALVLLFLHI